MNARRMHSNIPMPRDPSRRDAFWAFFVSSLLALASLGAWYSLEASSRDQGALITRQFAYSIADEIEWMLDEKLRSARRLTRYWIRFGRQLWDEWDYDTRLYLENNGLDSATWIDPAFRDEIWQVALDNPVTPAREEDRAALIAAQERTINVGLESVAGPFALEDGGFAYKLLVPAGRSSVLVVGKRLAPMFDEVLQRHTELCFLQVRYGDLVLYSGANDDCHSEIEGSTTLQAFRNQTWTLAIRPSASVVELSKPLSATALLGGVLTAILVGGVMWTRGLARARSLALARANSELEESTREARGAEAAVRRLNMELEERVKARTAALDEVVSDLETFNYSVSHDLRSPLGAIVNFAAILEQDHAADLSEEARSHLHRIENSALAAIGMMDSLLALSRAGRAPMHTELVDVRAMIEESWAELLAGRQSGDTVLEISDLPPVVADPGLLRLVFTNLLSNAVKFSQGRPKPAIEVGGRREDGICIYWVKDNGVGFRGDAAERIFGVFTRLHSTADYPGTGVGLAIVDRIIRRHRGRVWCEGAPDQGATFSFSLPTGDNDGKQ